MFKRVSYRVAVGLSATVLLLSACGVNQEPVDDKSVHAEVKAHEIDVIEPHKGLNQEPVPLNIERDGKDVYVEMTTQVTDIEIEPGYMYKAWTFNGEAPGPLIVVEEGDILHLSIDNLDPAIPHSIDLHAVHTNPDVGFADFGPNENGT
ncbi:MAG TPA: multicopper oxidase domain-containing protein, partial [Bacillota bacterium]|nr:multicopper oxidase domain-containing protein [Bacillota bacterium]